MSGWLRWRIPMGMIALFAVLILAVSPGRAQPLTLLGDNDYEPFSWQEDGQPKGIYVDILRRLLEEAELPQIELKMKSWKEGLEDVRAGRVFGLFPPYYWPEERPYMAPYSEQILEERVAVYCREGILYRKRPNWPQDYLALTIGNNVGYLSPGPAFFDAVKSGALNMVEVRDADEGLRLLVSDDLDCYVNSRLTILWGLRKLGDARIYNPLVHNITRGSFVAGQWGYIGFSKAWLAKHPEHLAVVETLNAAIRRLRESGETELLVDTFLTR